MPKRRIDTNPLSEAEYSALHPYLEPHWQLLYDVLWQTGIRVSEALALERGDLATDHIVVKRLKKTDPTYDAIPISDELLGGLRGRVNNRRRRVFPYTRQAAWAALRRAAGKAGILRDVHPHQVRHSFGRRIARSDLGLTKLDHELVLARLLGHSSARYVGRYTRPGDDEVREVWRRINRP